MAIVRCSRIGKIGVKFDAGKAWPHPVLRPPRYGDDYPEAEFEVEITACLAQGSTAIDLIVEFIMSSPKLLELVEEDLAQYALLVGAPQTHFRKLFLTKTGKIKKKFSAGIVAGRVEMHPFLVCMSDLTAFYTIEWHSDFEKQAFDIGAGSVLAEDETKHYFIDPQYEGLIGSIFKIRTDSGLPDGRWAYGIEEDHIWISMSQRDERIFANVRLQCKAGPEGYYIINGLYLPVLVASLNEIDCSPDEYRNFKWFASLDRRLEEVGGRHLGNEGANRVEDAQRVFDFPFLRMPIIAEKSGR